MSDRPDIPEPIKREVRQQCYFGCAICGAPVFHYDHIEEYSVVNEHTAENLVLLCPNHHNDKTTKKLSKERVIEAKLNPFNSANDFTEKYKLEPNRHFKMILGTNAASKTFVNGTGDHSCIWINGMNYLLIHSINYKITFSAFLTDDKGEPIIIVNYGELKVSSAIWDYNYVGNRLTIRDKYKRIILDINLSDELLHVRRAMFLHRSLDGFLVRNGKLICYCNGQKADEISNSNSSDNGFGAFGLNNGNIFPNNKIPRGFGYIKTVNDPDSNTQRHHPL